MLCGPNKSVSFAVGLARGSTIGFTLVEVLIGLALLVIALGVVLNNVSRDTMSIARSHSRYQALLRCSSQLERKMERESGQPRKGTEVLNTIGEGKESKNNPEAAKVETAVKVVTADPRVEQVEVTSAYSNNQRISLSAYRLRVRRQQTATNSTASNSTSPASNNNTSAASSTGPSAGNGLNR